MMMNILIKKMKVNNHFCFHQNNNCKYIMNCKDKKSINLPTDNI